MTNASHGAATTLVNAASPTIGTTTAALPSGPPGHALSVLADRVAHGDRIAFAALRELLDAELVERVTARIGSSRQARIVVDATFTDVWMLTRSHADLSVDIRARLHAVADAYAREALRFSRATGTPR